MAKKWRGAFTGSRVLKLFEETYQRQVKGPEATQPATAITVGKLQQERDQAKANAEKAAEGLAKEGPGQRSPLCRQALRLFLDGRIDAIKLLDEDELRRTAQEEKGKSPMPSRPGCSRAASLH
jgi:hypothetical protein